MQTPTTTNPARQLLRTSELSVTKLAELVGVSRMSYYKWLRGKTINEEHLATLSQLLQQYPPKEVVIITYEVHSISFTCRCNTPLTLKRRTGSSATGIFCSQCHEHYWINWQEGILRNGAKP